MPCTAGTWCGYTIPHLCRSHAKPHHPCHPCCRCLTGSRSLARLLVAVPPFVPVWSVRRAWPAPHPLSPIQTQWTARPTGAPHFHPGHVLGTRYPVLYAAGLGAQQKGHGMALHAVCPFLLRRMTLARSCVRGRSEWRRHGQSGLDWTAATLGPLCPGASSCRLRLVGRRSPTRPAYSCAPFASGHPSPKS